MTESIFSFESAIILLNIFFPLIERLLEGIAIDNWLSYGEKLL